MSVSGTELTNLKVRYEREAEVHYLYLSMRYIHDPQLINGSRSKFLLVVHDIYFL